MSDGEDRALLELVPYGLLDEAVGSERGGGVDHSSTQKALFAKQPPAGSLLNPQQWLITGKRAGWSDTGESGSSTLLKQDSII